MAGDLLSVMYPKKDTINKIVFITLQKYSGKMCLICSLYERQ